MKKLPQGCFAGFPSASKPFFVGKNMEANIPLVFTELKHDIEPHCAQMLNSNLTLTGVPVKHHLKFACITLCGMSLAASLALSAPKNTQPPLHTRIADYLENKVVGKTLHFHTTGRMAEGRIEFVFDRYVTYTSLARTQNGLRFDEVIAIKQANYDVVDGQRTGTPTIKDRSLVKSCELGERASTGNVVGFCRYVSSTLEDLTGTAEALTASLDDETLVLHEDSVNYLDFYAPSNTFEPGVVKTDSAFSLVKGKLKRLQTATSYRLDPNSLQRLDDSRSVQEYVDLQD